MAGALGLEISEIGWMHFNDILQFYNTKFSFLIDFEWILRKVTRNCFVQIT